MSQSHASPLATLSQELSALIASSTPGIVAVKALAYRVSSGVCIAPDLIAAADHAVKREERIPIHTHDGRQFKGTLIGRVPSIDLAVIRTEENAFQPIAPAPQESLRPGSLIAVVGLTTDVGPSASLGILGAVGESRRTWRGGVLDRFLRLDVNLYPSQIGAAVLNVEGQLIGLATPALLRHSAVAVPVGTLQRYANELLKEGRIRHGYLGVGVQPVAIPESLRTKLSLDLHVGLMIMFVNPESPAENAGMQLGDILVSLGTRQLLGIEDLQAALEGASIGNIVPALVVRGGELVPLPVTIAERPRSEKRSETN
jgi:S1-C subfamily serine protease